MAPVSRPKPPKPGQARPPKRGNAEGSVFFDRDKDRWVARIEVDGRRIKRLAKTKVAAVKLLDELKADVAKGAAPGDGNLTVATLLERWTDRVFLAQDPPPARATTEVVAWCVAVLTEELGTVRAHRLSAEQVDEAFARLASRPEKPLGRASLVKIRSVLGQALDYGQKRGYVVRNAARLADIPRSAKRTPEGRSLTVEQANRLLAQVVGHRVEALVSVMLFLGLRPGEATGLLWSDIDLDGAVLHVRHSLKSGRSGPPVLDEMLKTERSRRSLSVPAGLIVKLRAHRVRQLEERQAAGDLWEGDRWGDPVFTTEVGAPFAGSRFRTEFSALTTAAGLGHWHPHELRHSVASLLSAAGVPLENIADVLGHQSVAMLREVYRHQVLPAVPHAMALADYLGVG